MPSPPSPSRPIASRALSRLFRPPRSGNRFARVRLDVEDLLPRLKAEGQTITPFLAHACARALGEWPTLCSRVVGGAVRPRDSVVISVVVALGDGDNLAVVRIADADRKGVAEIAAEIDRGADRLRRGADADFEQSMAAVGLAPPALLRPGLALSGWVSGALGLTNRALGLHADPLGSLCLSNIGGLGLDEAFSPPMPFAYAPVDVIAGSVERRPTVSAGALAVRSCITLNLTVDARVVDWSQLDGFAASLRRAMQHGAP